MHALKQRAPIQQRRRVRLVLTTGESDAVDTAPVQRIATGESAVVEVAARLAADSRDFIHFRCRTLERELRSPLVRVRPLDDTRSRVGFALLTLGGLVLLMAVVHGLMSLFGLEPATSYGLVGSALVLSALGLRKLRAARPVTERRRPRALEDAMEHAAVRA